MDLGREDVVDYGTDEEEPPVKRRRGVCKEWTVEREFDSKEQALEFIKNEKCWSNGKRYDTRDGSKVQYRCKLVKQRGEQCPSGVMILYHAEKESVTLYRTATSHNHENKEAGKGIPESTKESIVDLFESGVKFPKAILAALQRRGIQQIPTRRQLLNFLQQYKRKAQGPPSMDLGQFELWCQERSQPDPADRNHPYVVAYNSEIEYSEEGNQLGKIRVFMSTPVLLENCTHGNCLHADATYKNVWEGHPLLVVGITDLDRHFHPAGLAICSGETEEDYTFLFRSLAAGIQSVCGYQYTPTALVADAADAISNGFRTVFGDGFLRVTCWFHVSKAIDRKLLDIVDPDIRGELRGDIEVMHECESEKIFDAAATLFFSKWSHRPDVAGFLEYFKRQWINQHKFWFAGPRRYTPCTNNAVESTNSSIKREDTLRNRLPLSRFLHLCSTVILVRWSFERDALNGGVKLFVTRPTWTTAVWTVGFHHSDILKRSMIPCKRCPAGTGYVHYFLPSAATREILGRIDLLALVSDYVNSVSTAQWPSFAHYVETRSSLWMVSVQNQEWDRAVCNCPIFLKEYVCKHQVALAIIKGHYEVPVVAMGIPIGEKRKRGRPKKASKALRRD